MFKAPVVGSSDKQTWKDSISLFWCLRQSYGGQNWNWCGILTLVTGIRGRLETTYMSINRRMIKNMCYVYYIFNHLLKTMTS